MKKTKWIASFVAGFVVLCMLFASCSQPSGGSPNGAGITNGGSDGSGSGGSGSGSSGSSTPTKSDIVNDGTPYSVTIDGQNCSFTFAEGEPGSIFGDGTVTIGTKTKSFYWWVSGSTVRVTIEGSEEFELTYSKSPSGTKTLSNPKSSGGGGILAASYTWDKDTKTITFTGPGKVTSMWQIEYEDFEFLYRKVEKVIIEAGVTSICDDAFNGCMNLFDVIINATTPPALHSNSTFSGCARSLTIQVPAECVEAYKTADGWSNYADKIIDNTLGALQSISVVPETVPIYFVDGITTKTEVAGMIGRAIEVTAHYENGDKLVRSDDYYSVYVISRTEASITYNGITKTIGLKAISSPSAGITWDESTKTITFSAPVEDIIEQWGDAQKYKNQVKKIIIENGVKSIGALAFNGCKSLECVEIPDSVTSIGKEAFYECSNLTSVNISSGVTSIGEKAFYKCSNLTSVNIPSGVASIGEKAFYGCTSLTSVVIPSGVTSIGEYTFYGCTSLTSVDIPSGVTSIGDGTFGSCTSLTSVDIPSGVTSIGKHAFSDCSNLTSVSSLDNVRTIGFGAFYECSNLTTVSSLDSVETIGNSAFYKCSKLSSVTIGTNIKEIRQCAFYECGFETLTIKASKPPRLLYDYVTHKHDFFPRSMNTIYVPADSVETYKKDWVDWDYAYRIKAIPSN